MVMLGCFGARFAASMFLEDGLGGLSKGGFFSEFTEVRSGVLHGLFKVDDGIGIVDANTNASFHLKEFRHFPWTMDVGRLEGR